MFPMPNSDPVQNQLLSELQKAEGREPCLAQSKTSIQETGADTLAVSPSQASFFTQIPILMTERKWKVITVNSSYGGALPTAISKTVTRMVRHYDHDERQPDAAVHWDTTRPVLLEAFTKHGARDFSEKHWLRLVHRGSSKTRYCEDSKNCLAFFRTIQGHSGGIAIDHELMGHILIHLEN